MLLSLFRVTTILLVLLFTAFNSVSNVGTVSWSPVSVAVPAGTEAVSFVRVSHTSSPGLAGIQIDITPTNVTGVNISAGPDLPSGWTFVARSLSSGGTRVIIQSSSASLVSGAYNLIRVSAFGVGNISLTNVVGTLANPEGTDAQLSIGNGTLDITSSTPPSPNTPPTIAITSPTEGQIITTNQYTITTNTGDVDGTVTQVVFYGRGPRDNTESIWCTDITPPFTCDRSRGRNGTNTVRGIATDDDGATTSSTTITFTTQKPRGGGGNPNRFTIFETTISFNVPTSGTVYDLLGRRITTFDNSIQLTLHPGRYIIQTTESIDLITISN